MAALGAGRSESVCLIDSRPLANAVANKLAGAGSESQAFYDDCEIRYIGLGNIHVIRESWNKLRALCQSRGVDGMSQQGQNWLVALHQSEWLQHVQHVLEGSLTIARLLDRDKRSCVTHCRFFVFSSIFFCLLSQFKATAGIGRRSCVPWCS